jgi:hypothetical protein
MELGIDPAIELIEIHRVQAALDAGVFTLQALESLLMLARLVRVALAKALGDPLEKPIA